MYDQREAVDVITVQQRLKDKQLLDEIGGIPYLNSLQDAVPSAANLSYYLEIVLEKFLLRKMIQTCTDVVGRVYDYEGEVDALMDEVERDILRISESRVQGGSEAIKQLVHKAIGTIENYFNRQGVLSGVATGFADLDRMTDGLHGGEMIVSAARPSMGKTSLCLTLAQNSAIQAKAVVAVFSLEMSKESLVMRMLSSEARVDAHRFRSGFLSRDEWARLAQALGVLAETKIYIDDTPGISVLEMRAKARRLAVEQKKLDLIIVDYLQLMSGSSKRSESRQQEVSQISRELKALAKELNVPMVALSQLSRAPENRTDHRPQLADLRESGAIEQDADLVAFIYREEQYNRTDENRNIAELIVAKQRNGPTDTVYLAFLNQFARFADLDRDALGAYLSRFDRSKGSVRINRGSDEF